MVGTEEVSGIQGELREKPLEIPTLIRSIFNGGSATGNCLA